MTAAWERAGLLLRRSEQVLASRARDKVLSMYELDRAAEVDAQVGG